MPDQYKTIASAMTTKCKIQRSLFIAHVRETTTETEARHFIDSIQNEHKQATHNCFAYRIGFAEKYITYFDDAGEPSGTAGKPILGAILSRDLTNVTVVVTRYFGGRKLGVRGLIDAYAGAAGDVLDHAGIAVKTLTTNLIFTCEYPQLDLALHLLNQCQGEVLESSYGERVELKIAIPRSLSLQIEKRLTEHGDVSR